jgi:hypothetical protein
MQLETGLYFDVGAIKLIYVKYLAPEQFKLFIDMIDLTELLLAINPALKFDIMRAIEQDMAGKYAG